MFTIVHLEYIHQEKQINKQKVSYDRTNIFRHEAQHLQLKIILVEFQLGAVTGRSFILYSSTVMGKLVLNNNKDKGINSLFKYMVKSCWLFLFSSLDLFKCNNLRLRRLQEDFYNHRFWVPLIMTFWIWVVKSSDSSIGIFGWLLYIFI